MGTAVRGVAAPGWRRPGANSRTRTPIGSARGYARERRGSPLFPALCSRVLGETRHRADESSTHALHEAAPASARLCRSACEGEDRRSGRGDGTGTATREPSARRPWTPRLRLIAGAPSATSARVLYRPLSPGYPMQDFEKLGLFYLGRQYDQERGQALDELLLYDSRDLVTHALCVGMTGSGKTGLCLA